MGRVGGDTQWGLSWELNRGLGAGQGFLCCPQTREGTGKLEKGWRGGSRDGEGTEGLEKGKREWSRYQWDGEGDEGMEKGQRGQRDEEGAKGMEKGQKGWRRD